MSDAKLVALLREVNGILLGLRDKALSRNNMETLAAELIPQIDAAIAEHEKEQKWHTITIGESKLEYRHISCPAPGDFTIEGYITEPEHKCGTCRHWQDQHENEAVRTPFCGNTDGYIYCAPITRDWFCADWQRKKAGSNG